MSRIILHIGDKVTHTTYGEGVVTVVDEEYCTVKFEEEELTFRLPDAFENGFLQSNDAIYVPDEEADEEDWDDEEDEEEDEEDDEEEDEDEDFVYEVPKPAVKPVEAEAPKKQKIGLLGWLIAIGIPASYTLPFAIIGLIIYLGTDSTFFLIVTIVFFLLYFVLVIYSVAKLSQPVDPSKSYGAPPSDSDSDSAARTAGLMFGAGLLGYHLGKHHKSSSERASDDWLWQEKYRDHDDYYEGDGW